MKMKRKMEIAREEIRAALSTMTHAELVELFRQSHTLAAALAARI